MTASCTAATPRVRNRSSQPRTRSATRSASASPPASRDCGGLADERGQRHGPHPGGALLLQRLEQREPLVGRLGSASRCCHRRPPTGSRGQSAARIGSTRLTLEQEQRDVAGASGRPSYVAPEPSSRATSAARSFAIVLAQLVDPDRAVACRSGSRPPGADAAAAGAPTGCADQPAPPVVGLDVEHRDLAGRRARRRGSAPGARRPAAASLRQLVARVCRVRGGAGSAEVGDHVAAAEGVDRLLRVADQDQRGVRR